MKLPDFRTALVIVDNWNRRDSVVESLEHESWIVHGIRRAEQALPVLAHIPYELIIIDCELPGFGGKDFGRLMHSAREWRAIHLVVLTSCTSAPLATELAHLGALPSQKRSLVGRSYPLLGHLAVKNGQV